MQIVAVKGKVKGERELGEDAHQVATYVTNARIVSSCTAQDEYERARATYAHAKGLAAGDGLFRIRADRIMANIGNAVVTMLALEGEVMLKPIVKQHWLNINPSNPAPQKAKMSFNGTCSRWANNDIIQKNKARPRLA